MPNALKNHIVSVAWFAAIALPLFAGLGYHKLKQLKTDARTHQAGVRLHGERTGRIRWETPNVRPTTRGCNAALVAWTSMLRIEPPTSTTPLALEQARTRYAAELLELRSATECSTSLSTPPQTLNNPSQRASAVLSLMASGLSPEAPEECLQQTTEIYALAQALSIGVDAASLSIQTPADLPTLVGRCALRTPEGARTEATNRLRQVLERRVPASRLFRELVISQGKTLSRELVEQTQRDSLWGSYFSLRDRFAQMLTIQGFAMLVPGPRDHEEAWVSTQRNNLLTLLRPLSPTQAQDAERWFAHTLRERTQLVLAAAVLETANLRESATTRPGFLEGAQFLDPYADVPLHWRNTGTELTLWSVGPNNRDEGGNNTPPADDLSVRLPNRPQ